MTIGSPTNVVVYATIDVESNVLHGKPLSKENARVSITRVIQGAAQIPYPINDEIINVEQAVGTYIAWPRNLTRKVKKSSAPVKGTLKGGKKNGGKKLKRLTDCVSEPDYVVTMG